MLIGCGTFFLDMTDYGTYEIGLNVVFEDEDPMPSSPHVLTVNFDVTEHIEDEYPELFEYEDFDEKEREKVENILVIDLSEGMLRELLDDGKVNSVHLKCEHDSIRSVSELRERYDELNFIY